MDGQVGLSWTAPTEDGGSVVTDYDVLAFVNGSSSPFKTVDTGSAATSATVSGLNDELLISLR